MASRADVLRFYRDVDGQWRWTFIAPGHTLGDGGQGYSRHIDARKGAARVLGVLPSQLRDRALVHRLVRPPVRVEVVR